MNYVILDLEWNGGYSAKVGGYINEIIEFGAVKLNEKMELIGQFSVLVKPELTKRLRSRVQTLTSLTNDDLKRGCPFLYALNKFQKFMKNCVLMTWSTSDLTALESNCRYHVKSPRLPFIKKYVDLQMYCQEMMGINDKSPIGLVAAAEMLGLDVEDIPHHRAVGDSIVSAKCLQKLYSKGAMKAHIQKADCDEFYERLDFRSTYLYNLDNPLVDKSVMHINCGVCGARANLQSPWESKNKSFYSSFVCPVCQNEFRAKIQFRVKYDGIVPVKKILTNNSEETEKELSAE